MPEVIIRDPFSGAIDYRYTQEPLSTGTSEHYVAAATDYDLQNAQPWASYSLRNEVWVRDTVVQVSAEAIMDDGSAFRLDTPHFGAGLGFPVAYARIATSTDAAARLDYVYEEYLGPPDPRIRNALHDEFESRALDYDGAGRLDYSVFVYRDGRTVSTDHDPSTGGVHYAYTVFHGGRTLAQDYDAGTGLLDYVLTTDPDGHSLAQDHDGAGRLDYAIERWADGRMVVNDYDVLDQFSWSIYSIAYAADGSIQAVAVL